MRMNTADNNAPHTQFQVPNVQQYQSTVPYPGGDSFVPIENSYNESNSVHSLSVGSEPKNYSVESSNVTHSKHEKTTSYHGLMPNAPEFNTNAVLHENSTINLPVYVDEYSRQPEVTSKFLKDPQHRSTRISGPKHNSPKLEVNAYDFPELGKEKEQKPHKTRNPRKNNNHQTDEVTVSSAGSGNKKSGRGKRHNKVSKNVNTHTILTNGAISSSTPPPGFRSGGFLAKQQSNVPPKNAKAEGGTYIPAPNATGEIRATARAFVPSNFKPPPASSTPVADKKGSGAIPPPGLDAPLFGSSGSHIPSASPASAINSSSFSTSGINAFTPSLAAPSTNKADPAALLPPVSSLLSPAAAPISSKNDTASTAPNASMSTLLASVSSSLLPPAPSPGLSSTSTVTGTGVPGIDDTSLYGSKLVNPSNTQEGAAVNSSIWGGGPSTGGFSTLNSFSFADTNQQQQPRPGSNDDKPAVGNFFLGGTGSGLGSSIW